jgi:hypothetical protein
MAKKQVYTIDDLNVLLEKNDAELQPLYTQNDEIQKRIRTLHEQKIELIKQKNALEYAAMKASGKVDWAMLLECGWNGYQHHQEIQDLLFEQLPSMALVRCGSNSVISQHILEVRIERNNKEQVKQVAALLNEILPHVKEMPDTGWKYFSVMEYTLREYGSIGLQYCVETGNWFCGRFNRYGDAQRGKDLESRWSDGPFKTAEEVLSRISEKYWYGDEPEETED